MSFPISFSLEFRITEITLIKSLDLHPKKRGNLNWKIFFMRKEELR